MFRSSVQLCALATVALHFHPPLVKTEGMSGQRPRLRRAGEFLTRVVAELNRLNELNNPHCFAEVAIREKSRSFGEQCQFNETATSHEVECRGSDHLSQE